MAQPWSLTLYDLPAFAGLEDVGRRFNVRFRLIGGTASRLAMALWHDRRATRTLVDLCPFSSDVDLEHSGDDSLTPEILEAIDAWVVDGLWCRWSVTGRQTAQALRDRQGQSTHIPLRSVVFESWRPTPIEDQAQEDLERGRVSLRPHADFTSTPARRAEQDLEIFGLLLALNTAADLSIASGDRVTVDREQAAQMLLRFAESEDRALLGRSPLLRRRLFYLSAALSARNLPDDSIPVRLMRLLGETAPVATLPSHGSALVVSAFLESGQFRTETEVDLNPDAGELQSLGPAAVDNLVIDPVFDLQGVSGELGLRAGAAPSGGQTASARSREFLHLAWRSEEPLSGPATAFALGTGGRLILDPAVGGAFPGGVRWLRMDIGALTQSQEPSAIRIGMLQGRTADKADPTRSTLPDSGGGGGAEREVEAWSQEAHTGLAQVSQAADELEAGYRQDPIWGAYGEPEEENEAAAPLQQLVSREG